MDNERDMTDAATASTTQGGFYIVGGRERKDGNRPEWQSCDRALILYAESASGQVHSVVEYVTPPETCSGEDPAILFKASTLAGNQLYACTTTEVLIYSLPQFQLKHYISHPHFNDVHHVAPIEGNRLAVVSTGLDLVVVMSLEGEVLEELSACEEPLWTRFRKEVDYRRVLTTKPYKVHANYAFCLNEKLWVTRADRSDAVCVERPEQRFQFGGAYPHDGVIRYGRIYFTTTDGQVWVFDAETRECIRCVDLNNIGGGSGPLGWARGIEVLSPERVVVGFTPLRPTRWKQKLGWVAERFGAAPMITRTHVAAYDLAAQKLLWEIPLYEHGLDVIFAVHRAPPDTTKVLGAAVNNADAASPS
jgi:hypothetical protein